jgi:hypothetical protein
MDARNKPHHSVLDGLRLDRDGAELHRQVLSAPEVEQLCQAGKPLLGGKAGARIFGGPLAARILDATFVPAEIVARELGPEARPVRAILFDKTAETNWSVGWHQDRTIAVRQRREVAGFGPWSAKDGIPHVEPPVAMTAAMLTIRVHLDACGPDNAPLLIAPGSHRLGRVPGPDIAAAVDRLGSVACLASAGDVWVYATAILHASERSRSDSSRRVLQIDYAAARLPGGLEWLGIDAL